MSTEQLNQLLKQAEELSPDEKRSLAKHLIEQAHSDPSSAKNNEPTPAQHAINALNYISSGLAIAPQYDEVLTYLLAHPDMVDPLTSICAQTHQQFGQDSEISLELFSDPEFEDLYLKLYIRQSNYDQDILDKIDSLSSKYSDTLVDLSGWLHITTDFRPPRLQNAI